MGVAVGGDLCADLGRCRRHGLRLARRIFDPDAGGLMEANEASTSSVTAMMSPSAFGGLTAAWTDPPYALLDLTGAPIAAAEG